MNIQRQSHVLTVCISLLTLFTVGLARAAVVENFDSHSMTGETTPPTGWTLIDVPGPGGGSYVSAVGHDGSGGNSGFAGEVRETDFSHDSKLPGAYIVNSNTLDPRQAFSGSFDAKIAEDGAAAADWIFFFGDIGSGLPTAADRGLTMKATQQDQVLIAGGLGGANLVSDTSINGLLFDTWYHVDISWVPTVAGTASGIFSADFTDPSTSGALGLISLPSDFTFDASLTAVQFGFGSLNDFAAFDNVSIGVGLPPSPPPDTDFTWNAGAGNWNTPENWSPNGTPGDGQSILSSHEMVLFGGAISSDSTVFTDTQVTINSVQFDNSFSYGIAGQRRINLIASTAGPLPSISVVSGNHEFQTAVKLLSDTTVDVASDSTLTFTNTLNLNGQTLTKTGDGNLAVNNKLNLGGGTLVGSQGTISGVGTIGGDVNNEGGTISPGDNAALSSGDSVSNVPEPSSLLLLVLGGLLILLRAWKR